MKKAEHGKTVTVIYDGYIDNKEIFESSKETGPMEFVLGKGQVLQDFEQNIYGMSEGDSKTFTLSPESGYGLHDASLVHTISRKGLKSSESIQPGMILGMDMEKEGEQHKVPATVTKVTGDTITVDFNHPLAGKELTYNVTLLSVTDAPAD